MESKTNKLPKGQCYPLKPTVLAEALARAGIGIHTHLIRAPGTLFDAYFWPPNQNVPYERLYVRIGSVSADRANDARRWAEDVMIAHLIQWIGAIMAADVKSPVRREEQTITFRPSA
jgi:hypothetical protein